MQKSISTTLRSVSKELKRNKVLFLMLLPAVIFVFIFSYLPMGGIIIAFKDYKYVAGIWGSEWNGFDNFEALFKSGKLLLLVKNTLFYNILFIAVGLVTKVSLAIMIAEMCTRKYKRTMQSFMMLPHFLSWVIVGGMAYNILNYEFGLLNQLLTALGLDKVDVYTNEGIWKYILTFASVWKETGYGMIFYLAAITGINPELYEAARVDGCGIMQRIRYITLPLIKPTTCILLLLSLGGILKGNMDMFYNLVGNNGFLYNATDVIDTYVYRSMLQLNDYGVTGAIGLFQSVIGFVLVVSVNTITKKLDSDSALF